MCLKARFVPSAVTQRAVPKGKRLPNRSPGPILNLISLPGGILAIHSYPDFGVSGANLEETMVNRAMLRISREIILVADASKFSKCSMSRITLFSEIDTVISDTSLDEEIQVKLRALSCNLILV
jgi:hypothetical protein